MNRSPPAGAYPAELAPILQTVLDAVIVMTPAGLISGWNAVAEQMFGWEADEALGQPLARLIVPHAHRAAHEQGIARLLAGDQPRVLGRRIVITALRKDGEEFPIELSITRAPSAEGEVFVGFLRDITSQKLAEAALRRQATEGRLLFDLATLAAEANSFDDALERTVETICWLAGWPVGHAFIVTGEDAPRLTSTGIWYEASRDAAARMRAATEAIDFVPGVGLPGTILATGEPQWVSDTGTHDNFVRVNAGYRGAFGFPLKSEGRIIAVLEFFSPSPAEPDPGLLLTVRTLGEQAGRVFERRRRQDREALLLRELNHRVKNLLTVVQAIASQTFRKAASAEEGLRAFSGRLIALARAQDLLLDSDWEAVPLRSAIEAAIDGSGQLLERFDLAGGPVPVRAAHATSIALAIHELCTNSVKYGALSNPGGRVAIEWGVIDGGESFAFHWRERGGPPVTPPERRGFGSMLLAGLRNELGGEIALAYPVEGLECRFTARLQPGGAAPA